MYLQFLFWVCIRLCNRVYRALQEAISSRTVDCELELSGPKTDLELYSDITSSPGCRMYRQGSVAEAQPLVLESNQVKHMCLLMLLYKKLLLVYYVTAKLMCLYSGNVIKEKVFLHSSWVRDNHHKGNSLPLCPSHVHNLNFLVMLCHWEYILELSGSTRVLNN